MTFAAPTSLFDRVNAALPQTQCRRCGYADCAAYAKAITLGEAAINQCPPGGQEGIARLSEISGQPAQALNTLHGPEGPRAIAVIDEAWCIGCTLCIKACPVDAIFGSNKLMHTVMQAYCTGCELCVPVCPVDCISLENTSGGQTGWSAWSAQEAALAQSRYGARQLRHQRSVQETAPDPTAQPPASLPAQADDKAGMASDRKRTLIEAALARARAQRTA